MTKKSVIRSLSVSMLTLTLFTAAAPTLALADTATTSVVKTAETKTDETKSQSVTVYPTYDLKPKTKADYDKALKGYEEAVKIYEAAVKKRDSQLIKKKEAEDKYAKEMKLYEEAKAIYDKQVEELKAKDENFAKDMTAYEVALKQFEDAKKAYDAALAKKEAAAKSQTDAETAYNKAMDQYKKDKVAYDKAIADKAAADKAYEEAMKAYGQEPAKQTFKASFNSTANKVTVDQGADSFENGTFSTNVTDTSLDYTYKISASTKATDKKVNFIYINDDSGSREAYVKPAYDNMKAFTARVKANGSTVYAFEYSGMHSGSEFTWASISSPDFKDILKEVVTDAGSLSEGSNAHYYHENDPIVRYRRRDAAGNIFLFDGTKITGDNTETPYAYFWGKFAQAVQKKHPDAQTVIVFESDYWDMNDKNNGYEFSNEKTGLAKTMDTPTNAKWLKDHNIKFIQMDMGNFKANLEKGKNENIYNVNAAKPDHGKILDEFTEKFVESKVTSTSTGFSADLSGTSYEFTPAALENLKKVTFNNKPVFTVSGSQKVELNMAVMKDALPALKADVLFDFAHLGVQVKKGATPKATEKMTITKDGQKSEVTLTFKQKPVKKEVTVPAMPKEPKKGEIPSIDLPPVPKEPTKPTLEKTDLKEPMKPVLEQVVVDKEPVKPVKPTEPAPVKELPKTGQKVVQTGLIATAIAAFAGIAGFVGLKKSKKED